ncbi:MAG: MFS transporter [Solirubrobacterales bacterium]
MRATFKPLRDPDFRPLVVAFCVNELGDWLGSVALAILVFDQTGSALATAGLFLATQFLPAFLAPPLVARLEILRSGRALPAVYAAEGIVFALLALTASEFSLVAVFVLAAIDGALASAARALSRAMAAAMLAPRGLLREGNAILNLAFTGGAAAGPALAGIAVAIWGVQGALLGDAASFLLVAALLVRVPALRRASSEAAPWSERLREGLEYVRSRPVLMRLISAEAAAIAFFALIIPIEVVFAIETLGAGDAGYGALLAAWGTGMFAGAIVFTALRGLSLRALLLGSTLAIGLAYLATAAAPTLLFACAAAVVGGAGNGIQWVSLVSAVQELTADEFQARVVSVLESAASAAPGIGFVAGGVIAVTIGPRASFAVAGAGVLVVLAIAAVALRNAPLAGPKPPRQIAADPARAATSDPLHSQP